MKHFEIPRRQMPLQPREASETRVQFLDDNAQSGIVVSCETSHPGGMLAPLVKSLSHLDLEVHQIESRLNNGMRSERLWIAAADGEPLSQRRQGLVRTAVLSALETVHRAEQLPPSANDQVLSELNAG